MPRRPIYLDHHATTPVDPLVVEAMQPWWSEEFGNAASTNHAYGWTAAAAVDDARERIAARLGASPEEIVFTSGATESDNLAVLGAARGAGRARRHVVTVATEHPAVLDPTRQLEREGFDVTVLPVDEHGLVEPAAVADALREDTALVSVMLANGEIGTLQPVREIAALCRERGVLCHSDAAQAVGRIPVDVAELGVDLLSTSAHKHYGPKGIGTLYVRRRVRRRIQPLLFGGGHQGGLRSGTLPVPAIVGMARALELCLDELPAEAKRQADLRDGLWAALERGLPGVRRNGHPDRRLPGNLNVSFPDVDGDRLLLALSDLAVSSGSACSTASPEPSHVLLALGLSEPQARASLRFGLGRGTAPGDVETAAARTLQEVRALQG